MRDAGDVCCVQAWNIGKVCFEADTEPYSVERDKNMCKGITAAGIPWHSFVSHTLYVRPLFALAVITEDLQCCQSFV